MKPVAKKALDFRQIHPKIIVIVSINSGASGSSDIPHAVTFMRSFPILVVSYHISSPKFNLEPKDPPQ